MSYSTCMTWWATIQVQKAWDTLYFVSLSHASHATWWWWATTTGTTWVGEPHSRGHYLSWWANQSRELPELVSHTTTGTTWVGEPTQPRALPELVSHTITGTTWVGEKLIRTRAYVSSPPTRKKESKVFWWLIESFDSTRVLLLIYVHNLPFPCTKGENFFLQFFLYDWKLHF